MCDRDASSVFCTVVQERASGAALSLTAALQGGDPLLIKKPKFSYTLHAHAAATVIQRAWLGRKDHLRKVAIMVQYAFKYVRGALRV